MRTAESVPFEVKAFGGCELPYGKVFFRVLNRGLARDPA